MIKLSNADATCIARLLKECAEILVPNPAKAKETNRVRLLKKYSKKVTQKLQENE